MKSWQTFLRTEIFPASPGLSRTEQAVLLAKFPDEKTIRTNKQVADQGIEDNQLPYNPPTVDKHMRTIYNKRFSPENCKDTPDFKGEKGQARDPLFQAWLKQKYQEWLPQQNSEAFAADTQEPPISDYPALEDIQRTIQAAVEALEPNVRARYLDFAVFPEDALIPEDLLETLWKPEGLNEHDTQYVMNELLNRSLVQQDVLGCLSLHYLLFDYLHQQAGDLTTLHNRLLSAYTEQCSEGWHTGNDSYFFEHLAYHLMAAGKEEELRRLLFDFNWLVAKLESTGVTSLVADYDFLTDDKDLHLVQRALQLSAHILERDKTQLAGQLLGRLLYYEAPEIQALLEQAKQWKAVPWLRPLTASLMPPEGSLLRTLMGHKSSIKAVAVTPNGKLAVSASSDELKVWDLNSGLNVQTLCENLIGSVETMAVTPDGHYAISAFWDLTILPSNYTLTVWDLKTGRKLHSWVAHTMSINAVTVTPDGNYAISASNDNTLKVWNWKSGEELCTLEGHTMSVNAVTVTPDGDYAISASNDNTLKVWNWKSGEEVHTLYGHTDNVTAVAVTPDGRCAISASWDKTLRVWDLKSGRVIRKLLGHNEWVMAVAVTPNGKYAISGSNDDSLKVWNLQKGAEHLSLKGHTSNVAAVAATPDRKCAISGSDDNTLKVWNLESRSEQPPLTEHTGSVRAIAVTPDGQYAITASNDTTLKVWDLKSKRVMRPLIGHTSLVTAVAVTPDGNYAISTSHDNTVKVWNLESEAEPRTFTGHIGGITAMAVSSDGQCAISASLDGTIKIWELNSGAERLSFRIDNKNVSAMTVTPDGLYAISDFEDKTLQVWDINSGGELLTLSGHRSYVTAVTVTPDGKYAISASEDETIKVWDLRDGATLFTLYDHTAAVTAVAVTLDGQRLLSTSRDHTLKVWNLANREVIASFSGDSTLHCCAVASDGVTIVAGEQSGRVHFLSLEGM
jgi:WD40 repeat protein